MDEKEKRERMSSLEGKSPRAIELDKSDSRNYVNPDFIAYRNAWQLGAIANGFPCRNYGR